MLLQKYFLYPLKAAFLGGFRLGGSPGSSSILVAVVVVLLVVVV